MLIFSKGGSNTSDQSRKSFSFPSLYNLADSYAYFFIKHQKLSPRFCIFTITTSKTSLKHIKRKYHFSIFEHKKAYKKNLNTTKGVI